MHDPRKQLQKDQKTLSKLLKRGAKNSRVQNFITSHEMSLADVCSTPVTLSGSKGSFALHHLCRFGKLSLVSFVFSRSKSSRLDMDQDLKRAVLTKDSEGNTPVHVAAARAYKLARKHDPRVDPEAAKKIDGTFTSD